MSTLIGACIEGDLDSVERLLDSNPACVHERDEVLGSTPLIFAAHRGYLAIVERLLASGAAIDARERVSHTTALHWAAEGGHPAVLERLLAAGATLEVVDDWFGLGPHGWASVVRWAPERWADRAGAGALLLSRGGHLDSFSAVALGRLEQVNLTDRLGFVGRGRTPLHFAIREHPARIGELLALGADPLARDDWGVSALAEALLQGRREALPPALPNDPSAALVAGEPIPATVPGLLAFAAERGLARGLRGFLALGTPVDEPVRKLMGESASMATPLHLAAEGGHLEVASLLLEAGADPNARAAGTDQTPLHRAVVGHHAGMVRLLLARGANPTLEDRQFHAAPASWAAYEGDATLVAAFGPQADRG